MAKPKILLLQAGGTIGQKKGSDGVYRPSDDDYLHKIPEIHDLADITIKKIVNIDSTNMETSHRVAIARAIYENNSKYDGFVVVHGTDTMVDSAAAFNYMIQDLGKPIVLTGAQKSIYEPGSDGPNNLYYAIKAATLDLGEIVIAFGDRIVRGNRAIKVSEHGLNAFDSPRMQPVGEIGIDIMLAEHRIRRHEGKPSLFIDFDTNIAFCQQSSGTAHDALGEMVAHPNVHGIVLGAYGAGNVQDRLLADLKNATKRGKPVLVATNCQLGAADMGLYSVGSAPLKAGAISAGDMTMECCVQKLMYALGKLRKNKITMAKKIAFTKKIAHTPISGDITIVSKRF